MKIIFGIIAIIGIIFRANNCTACYRKPQGASGDRSPVDENYQIQIDGNPTTYIPGQQYNISLAAANGLKFISFTLLVEPESPSAVLPLVGDNLLGRFEIIDNAETKFSTLCESMIESSNTNTKHRVDVAWVAPSDSQSGCVLFKAAVLQHRNVWFIDDGFLTKRLCPEEIDEVNSQTPLINPCCACDEAKYEIVLERKWMRNTHARDFPSEAWRTRLGEVIGASHTYDYRFWEYGGRASQGLQELAEHGATRTLESEIRQHTLSGNIRTIIKAPGIIYRPNIVGKTLATVRVGREHHAISLVSKIDPSPDWILGVAGLELCLVNCTWIEKKVLNLYPWDVGTDAGPTYMSPDQAQYPPDVIRRITSTFPSDYRSPFFDESGAPMKPLATLHVTRKRTYERACNFEETGPLECSTHPWNNWTDCNVKCGAGTQYQIRAYKDPQLATNFNCSVLLRRNRNCVGYQCGLQVPETATAECELTAWSNWSPCSKKCGKGFQSRTRNYNNPYAREKCQSGVSVELEQTRSCNGNDCGGNIFTSAYDTNNDNNMFNENFDEEFEPNVFDRPNYDNNRFNADTNKKSWKPEEVTYPTEQFNNMDYNNDNNQFRSQISRPPPGGINPNEEEFVNVNNIYGSEKLVGKSRNRYGEEDESQNQNLFGDLESTNLENTRLGNNRIPKPYQDQFWPAKKYDSEQNKPLNRNRPGYGNVDINTPTNQYGSDQNTPLNRDRLGYGSADFNTPSNQYGADQIYPSPKGNSMFNNRYNNNPTGFSNSKSGLNQDLNPYGFKTIEGENSENDNYCLQKPVASTIHCNKKRLIVKNYWFFDADDGECKLFTADNCDENKNKFRRMEQCEEACAKTREMLPNNGLRGYGNRGNFEQTQRPSYRSKWN